jgi:hypothetical protein
MSVNLLVELMRAVGRLALSADEQIAFLKRKGLYPSLDELVLEFDDLLPFVAQFPENGWLSKNDEQILSEIRGLLDKMSGHESEDIWNETSLRTHRLWTELRHTAAAFLTTNEAAPS